MELVLDTENLTDAGFDTYLMRVILPSATDTSLSASRLLDASNLVGGIIGSEGIIYLGSKQIKLDGKNRRIVVNDGANDRVIIGQI